MSDRLPTSDNPDDSLEAQLGWLINDVYWQLLKEFAREGAELGLTAPQWRVLAHLLRADGLTQTELSDIIGMEKAPVGRLIDRLEESQLVERRADPSDRRVKRVYARPSARDRLAPMRDIAERIFAKTLSGLDEREVSEFLRALRQIKDNLSPSNDENS